MIRNFFPKGWREDPDVRDACNLAARLGPDPESRTALAAVINQFVDSARNPEHIIQIAEESAPRIAAAHGAVLDLRGVRALGENIYHLAHRHHPPRRVELGYVDDVAENLNYLKKVAAILEKS